MHTAQNLGDGFDDNALVSEAVASIRCFALPGAEHLVTREQAGGVIEWWQHFHELSEAEVAAILRRFPPGADTARRVTR